MYELFRLSRRKKLHHQTDQNCAQSLTLIATIDQWTLHFSMSRWRRFVYVRFWWLLCLYLC
jgi:hypothetical protein